MKPLANPPDLLHSSACLCTALRRASRSLIAAYDRALTDAELTSSQFILLARLSETGPVPIKELARAIGIDRTTLSRTLGPLTRRRLISETTGEDRRIKWISITAKGTAAKERAETAWAGVQETTLAAFGAERAAQLLENLALLASSIGAEPTDPPRRSERGA